MVPIAHKAKVINPTTGALPGSVLFMQVLWRGRSTSSTLSQPGDRRYTDDVSGHAGQKGQKSL